MIIDPKTYDHWLLEPTTLDIVGATSLVSIIIIHKLWSQWFTTSENIPESFWYEIPQASINVGFKDEEEKRTRNIQQEISSRVGSYSRLNTLMLTALATSNGHLLGQPKWKGGDDRQALCKKLA